MMRGSPARFSPLRGSERHLTQTAENNPLMGGVDDEDDSEKEGAVTPQPQPSKPVSAAAVTSASPVRPVQKAGGEKVPLSPGIKSDDDHYSHCNDKYKDGNDSDEKDDGAGDAFGTPPRKGTADWRFTSSGGGGVAAMGTTGTLPAIMLSRSRDDTVSYNSHAAADGGRNLSSTNTNGGSVMYETNGSGITRASQVYPRRSSQTSASSSITSTSVQEASGTRAAWKKAELDLVQKDSTDKDPTAKDPSGGKRNRVRVLDGVISDKVRYVQRDNPHSNTDLPFLEKDVVYKEVRVDNGSDLQKEWAKSLPYKLRMMHGKAKFIAGVSLQCALLAIFLILLSISLKTCSNADYVSLVDTNSNNGRGKTTCTQVEQKPTSTLYADEAMIWSNADGYRSVDTIKLVEFNDYNADEPRYEEDMAVINECIDGINNFTMANTAIDSLLYLSTHTCSVNNDSVKVSFPLRWEYIMSPTFNRIGFASTENGTCGRHDVALGGTDLMDVVVDCSDGCLHGRARPSLFCSGDASDLEESTLTTSTVTDTATLNVTHIDTGNITCSVTSEGDGDCDDECNTEENNWDGGDCCAFTVQVGSCVVCECLDQNSTWYNFTTTNENGTATISTTLINVTSSTESTQNSEISDGASGGDNARMKFRINLASLAYCVALNRNISTWDAGYVQEFHSYLDDRNVTIALGVLLSTKESNTLFWRNDECYILIKSSSDEILLSPRLTYFQETCRLGCDQVTTNITVNGTVVGTNSNPTATTSSSSTNANETLRDECSVTDEFDLMVYLDRLDSLYGSYETLGTLGINLYGSLGFINDFYYGYLETNPSCTSMVSYLNDSRTTAPVSLVENFFRCTSQQCNSPLDALSSAFANSQLALELMLLAVILLATTVFKKHNKVQLPEIEDLEFAAMEASLDRYLAKKEQGLENRFYKRMPVVPEDSDDEVLPEEMESIFRRKKVKLVRRDGSVKVFEQVEDDDEADDDEGENAEALKS